MSMISKFLMDCDTQLEKMNIEVDTLRIEDSPSQVEFVIVPRLGITGADNTFFVRSATKEIAQKHGMIASFASYPKPSSLEGNGQHFNFSLWRKRKITLKRRRNSRRLPSGLLRCIGNHPPVWRNLWKVQRLNPFHFAEPCYQQGRFCLCSHYWKGSTGQYRESGVWFGGTGLVQRPYFLHACPSWGLGYSHGCQLAWTTSVVC